MTRTQADPTADLIDACARGFEAARRRGPAAVRDHLPPPGHPARPAVAAELVRVDLEIGWDSGRPRPLADYLREFPDLLADSALLGEVCFEEFRQRADHGRPASPNEYAVRYGVDTSGWGESARPATAVVSAAAPVAGAAAAADDRTLPGGVMPVLKELQVSAPLAAERLAAGAAVFPKPGDEFAGFRLDAELGRGAFARVFLARQADLAGRPVALKVTALAADESATLAQLQHTNIVPIFSAHRRGPLAAVCMPYVGGTTLADLIDGLRAAGGGLPESGRYIVSTLAQRRASTRPDSRPASAAGPEADAPAESTRLTPQVNTELLARLSGSSYVDSVLWLLARLAAGLHHAHTRGIIHRDLKPANVLLTDDGQPMLLDFNLSGEAPTTEGAAVARVGGTLPYMAPEHLRAFADGAGTVDARSDLYALGLVAFELLAGRHPFPTPKGPLAEVLPAMLAQRQAGPPTLRPLNPRVGPAVEAVVHKLLAPDPAARYQSARDLEDDLERQLAHRPLKFAPNPSARERAQKWARRHPRLSSAGSVATLAAGLLLAGGLGAGAYRARAEADDFHSAVARHAAALGAGLGDRDPARLRADLEAARATLSGQPGEAGLLPGRRERLRADADELRFLTARVARTLGEAGAPDLPPADPNSPRGLYLTAFDRVQSKDYPAALALARRSVDADPTRPAGWFIRGLAADRLNQAAQAEAAYDVTLALAPDHYRARFNRGLVRLREKQFAAAADDFAACMADPRHDGYAAYNRAIARQNLGDLPGAVADLQAALDAGFPPTRALLLRSRLYRQMNDPQAAAADLAAGLAATPADAVGWAARGLARRGADPKAAVADFDQALALDPFYPVALQNKASVLAEELKDQAGSAAALTRLLDRNPRDVPALTGRAVVRARLGDRAGAVADADATLAIGRDPEAVYMLAGAYALLSAKHPDDKPMALRLLTEALRGGFGFQHLATDPELNPLRGDPDFERVVAAAKRLQPAGP